MGTEHRWETRPGEARTAQALSEPTVLRSSGGELSVQLEAARGPVRLAGRDATALAYNGGSPGPTLYLRPGDRLRIHLANRMTEPTNLHTHGLYVSPAGTADNVFVSVAPGESFDYDYLLPPDHPPGVFWYHPHLHHLVADQLFGGLCGAIVVEEPETVPVSRERVLVITDITLDGSGQVAAVSRMQRMAGREGDLVLVNGQLRPQLATRPGERERWRVVNACSSRFLRLRLDGQRLQLLGIDSGRQQSPTSLDEVVLAPGNRADLLVTAAAGTSVLRTLRFDRGRVPGMGGGAAGPAEVELATLRVSGAAVAEPGRRAGPPGPRGPARERGRGPPAADLRHGGGGWSRGEACRSPSTAARSTPTGPIRASGSAPSRSGRSATPARWTTRSTCTCGRCS